MVTLKSCNHPTCRKPITKTAIACNAHWFQLPEEMRARMALAYANPALIREAVEYWAKQSAW